MREERLVALCKKIGYSFSNLELLEAAVTHRSKAVMNNERLEFLGDAILNFTIAAELYSRFPKATEGDLTRMRARLVRGETIAELAKEQSLGEYLNLGVGELKTGGHQRESILADAIEAIIGAIYLDSNIEICRQQVLRWYGARLESLIPGNFEKDPKTRLQEYLQARHAPLPEYQVLEIVGDDHNPTFKVQCTVSLLEKPYEGLANNRRKAEQSAAEATLKDLLRNEK
jgi:ribonuclease-3